MSNREPHRPLNILFRLGPFPKLSETFVMSQIEGLVAQGHQVSVLAEELCSDFEFITSPVIEKVVREAIFLEPDNSMLGSLLKKIPYRIKQAIRNTKEKDAYEKNDVVICNFGWMGIEAAKQMKDMPQRAKLVTIFHGADMSSFLKDRTDNPYEDLFSIGDSFLPISHFWKSKLLDLGAPKDKIDIHRMGVYTNTFQYKPREINLNKPFRFITVGRLTEKKGVEYTIRAASKLKEQLGEGLFYLTIIGNGPLEKELRELNSELGLNDIVTFTGALAHKEVAVYLEKSDAFLLPSVTAQNGDMEGIPVALMEAMASGLPVISTRHSGIPELVIDNKTGLLADERDASGLADAMLRILQNHEDRNHLAEAARFHVETEFNNEVCNQKLSELCVSIASDLPTRET